MSRILICTDDPDLLEDLLRLAAAAGLESDVVRDILAARQHWSSAPAVLVGGDLSAMFSDTPLPRRSRVVLVGLDLDDADVWRRAMSAGADHVVFLPDAEPWIVEFLVDADDLGGCMAPLVAVVGGRGGAGASTLASALAVTALLQGMSAMLIDVDPAGGGLDLAVGGEDTAGLRWPDLAATRGRVSAGALSLSLPRVNDLTVLSWDRGSPLAINAEAIESVLAAARRDTDVVVADLPRSFDEAARAVLVECSMCLIVVPAEVRACAAACRIACAALADARDVRLVVRGPAPSRLRAEQIASVIGLPLAGYLRPEPGLAAAAERGDPPARTGRGPLAHFSRRFLERDLGLHSRRAAA
ncbi:MAG: septum site-determining protein Ssd [Actinomycetota bacterium]